MSDTDKKHDLVIKRIVDAPLERVWKAWTDPAQVQRWWGPKDYTSPSCKLDLRVGGRYLLTITESGWMPGQMAVYSLAGMHQSIDKLAECYEAAS